MFNYILLVLSSLALTTAIRLDVGPQTFSEQQYSLPSQKADKRFVSNQGFKYYIPVQINNEQNEKAENKQLGQQNFERQAYWPLINISPSGKLQVQNLEQAQGVSIQNEKPSNENSQEGLEFLASFSEQKPKQQYQLVRYQQGNELEREPISFNQDSNKEQEENNLREQIKQQLKSIVENNQVHLKALSSLSEPNQFANAAQSEQQSTLTQYSNQKEEQGRAGIRKEIENILRDQANLSSNQQISEAEESNYEKSPFFIHRLVRVTKHHPVNIVKEVKVPVPTPVLVPVPEPYEVKVPHPYHVPVEVIRHIPIPIERH